MKVYVCRICGEVYIGDDIPPSCPFCGVEKKFMVLGHVWKDENNVELSAISHKNLEESLKLEISNTKFYNCIETISANTEIAKMFKGLRKVENEHASVFRKLLKLEQDPELTEDCVDDVMASLEDSSAREERAINLYAKAAEEAIEPRVKEVFLAIMKAEKDHLALDQKMMAKYQNKSS